MNAGVGRRFAALLYDALLVLAFLLLYTALVLFASHGEALIRQNVGAWVYLYYGGELGIIATYYVVSCRRTGHTLGMRAWRLRVQGEDGAPPSTMQLLLRWAVGSIAWAAGGLGVLWLYVDPDRLAWQDRLSRTRVVRLT